jgi:dTDP-4-amino-4,6-dideoxygalactose transaminase
MNVIIMMWRNSRLDSSIQAAVLNAKLPLLDQYGRARQDASRKYSAAFEGHKNIVAQVFVIYVIVTSFINIPYEL